VRLQIWREPDLSGDFPVDETGTVVFPKVGSMRVTTLPPASLKRKLLQAYAAYLNNLSIRVEVLRRVQVLGAVNKPGLYSVDPTMSVADAIALAGGITGRGKQDLLELRRGGEKVSTRLSSNVLIGDSPIRSGDQLYVPERSWASRNPGIIIGALGLVSGLIWNFTH
jgi:polysaccharide export outer membrane protein